MGNPMSPDPLSNLPDLARIHALLRQYVPVRLVAEKSHLTSGDRRSALKLIKAARWVDEIYWQQRSEIGWQLANTLRGDVAHRGGELDRLLRINYGPWDSLDGDAPFWGSSELPAGANFYPPDLTRTELAQYLALNPTQEATLLKSTTLVRRRGDRLVAVPYEQAYEKELGHIAKALTEASRTTTHDGFRRYVMSRAEGLQSGDLSESERLWVRASDAPIDLVIGPYEVYDDTLKGVKTSYEAAVLIRHPLSTWMEEFERYALELGQELPGAVADPVERNVRIGVFDVEYSAGMLNMGSKAIAATLPNDERVRQDTGTRLLLFRNVIEAKFDSILRPLADCVLTNDQLPLVEKEAFTLQTLLHETGHALSRGYVEHHGRLTSVTINEALGERYSTIEECRAELLGAYFLANLARRGVVASRLEAAAATTFVAHSVRAVRFGDKSDHARAAAISLNHLCRCGAIRLENEKLRIDPARTHAGVAQLMVRVQTIANEGDYDAAGRLITELGNTPREVEDILPATTGVPVDLEFVFEDSLLLP